ncbi:phosphatase inhibitor-domain-containing protein [Radiomyces spectabilis]|uniref:phosphatase inhibitor-domain-containing protein n=1 Tax=Radiomyces spectabilis TaxID=64574 RepID=UPI00222038A8|nr:phosphatase inhibitor-domain-containing protein [Radiomyces spectabilis]KAI8378015.1 phosphatase inhibitor-domain-containing protein [Radiomyces spectabilis]
MAHSQDTRYVGQSTRMRDEVSTPTHGSRTMTIDPTSATESEGQQTPSDEEVGILRLTGDMSARRPRAIRWDEDVVDNEHMNKKKSKICCIYHKPHVVGESSDSESSSDSDSSSSSSGNESDNNTDKHSHQHKCGHRHGARQRRARNKRNPREVSPNAYEIQPVYKTRPQPSNHAD